MPPDATPACFPPGRYFVLTPAGGEGGVSLSAAGEQFVIDPYSEGMLLSVAEVGAACCACCACCVLKGLLLSVAGVGADCVLADCRCDCPHQRQQECIRQCRTFQGWRAAVRV